ncbi:MAG TPA: type I restriction enzyme HsdR N-terminal domain-containing protein, partial [Balneolaceae bacterium]|nr:type I restriction enzyme HsdR N-terminal domain-containing protein [Balneolaceae bacterium]
MKSASLYHFPQVIIEDGQKWLFNPVLKKRFKNRPEERVRLQWVDFLLNQTDWNKNRIGFETPVQLRREDRALRADLLLYSDDVAPYALIECKSDQIKLSDSTAVQAARYNSLLHAPYIILTNGREDLVYKVEDGTAKST